MSWFCFRVFSQSRRHPDQMLGRSLLVPLFAAEQQLYSALGCLSPSHSPQGHAQAEETHFSCLHLWLHSFGYYIKLMTIGEDGNVDRLAPSTANVLSFCVNCLISLFFFDCPQLPTVLHIIINTPLSFNPVCMAWSNLPKGWKNWDGCFFKAC